MYSVFLLLSFLPAILCTVSFPLTAISHYSELSPCAVSHLSGVLDRSFYGGCTSATPISAYGSCMCAQRLRSIQYSISLEFRYDDECSSTAVQPYLTAFCGQWGVDIAAAEKAKPSTTTTLGGGRPTGQGIPSLRLQFVLSETNSRLLLQPPLAAPETQGNPRRLPHPPMALLPAAACLTTKSPSSPQSSGP